MALIVATECDEKTLDSTLDRVFFRGFIVQLTGDNIGVTCSSGPCVVRCRRIQTLAAQWSLHGFGAAIDPSAEAAFLA
jgi:hypothetical protein